MKTNLLATTLLIAVATLPAIGKEEASKPSVVAQSAEAPAQTPWKSFMFHVAASASTENSDNPAVLITYDESEEVQWSQAVSTKLTIFMRSRDGASITNITNLNSTNSCVQTPDNLTKRKDGSVTFGPIKVNNDKCLSPMFKKTALGTALITCNSGKDRYTFYNIDKVEPVEAGKEATAETAPQTQ